MRLALTLVLLLPVLAGAAQPPKATFPRAHMLALCSTEDGRYRVFVVETKGSAPTPKLIFAAIKDENGNYVASYWGEKVPGQSKKYGNVKYVDAATGGSQFVLDAPSEANPGFQIDATITVDGKKVPLHGENMQCSAYNRQLPGR